MDKNATAGFLGIPEDVTHDVCCHQGRVGCRLVSTEFRIAGREAESRAGFQCVSFPVALCRTILPL